MSAWDYTVHCIIVVATLDCQAQQYSNKEWYSETSEERTHWGQDSCSLWRGRPYLGG